MVVCLSGQKGGTGKSTLAISIASEWVARGLSVLLVDADTKNRTSLRAAAIAEEEGRAHPTTIGMAASELNAAIRKLRLAYQHIVIDAPGRSGVDLTAPLMVADLALFPSAPTTADAGVFEEQLEAIGPIRRERKNLRVAIVLTKLLSRTKIAEGRNAVRVYESTGLPVLKSKTYTRLAWQRCLDVGVGVAQLAPKSLAAEELRAIMKEIRRNHAS